MTDTEILGAVDTPIPTVTLDEQRALQIENVKSEERFWQIVHDMHAGTIGMDAAAKREAAKERRLHLERGEDVPDGERLTLADLERILPEVGPTPCSPARGGSALELSGGPQR